MKPWYQVVTPRPEVREGRSFSPDEFAIALEQVVAGTAPEDYRDPRQFFSRTCFTDALTTHVGMVLRRLAGRTGNTDPVLTLLTQFGGGKTHTLTALYHLTRDGKAASDHPGIPRLLSEAGLREVPRAAVGVFVGSAWDPQEGREAPWIDVARQVAGDRGVAALGSSARDVPPGTEALARVFAEADAPVLFLFDEVLNFVNRHRNFAEPFYAFIQNLTVAVTGTTRAAAVISLPRSQIEMTDWDRVWQDKITKVVRRVARDLIINDESEISEVVRRRLFEDLGSTRIRGGVARRYAEWCFERRAQLPPEWMAVDTTATEAKAREFLRGRFAACYPFHPSTLMVFQRKWGTLPQFQQTRGALAMLAQWISLAAKDHFRKARTEPLITLGSAPLDVPQFRSVILGQLGESLLDAAIHADIAGRTSRARPLDADTTGALRDIHRRVGTAILFESSGGQIDKVAHLPELRFALGEPDVDTTSVDNAAAALERTGFFIRKVGTDGYQIHHKATLKKVVHDRRASLDEETEVRPAIRRVVEQAFKGDKTVPVSCFPESGADVPDSARLRLVVVDPRTEWTGSDDDVAARIGEWTRRRGKSPRLFPAALVWCIRKPGEDLRAKVEMSLAWAKVAKDLRDGILGSDYDARDRKEVQSYVREAREAADEEVWASYRFVALADATKPKGLAEIDLGAGHSSASQSLCGRVIGALKSEGLLNESVGAGYIGRHWPRAFKQSGAWPLTSLRQSFLDGSLTRLPDPDSVLRRKIVEFVTNGDFGFASGAVGDGKFDRVWFQELLSPDDVVFEDDVLLLTRAVAEKLSREEEPGEDDEDEVDGEAEGDDDIDDGGDERGDEDEKGDEDQHDESGETTTLRLEGTVPPEAWNRIGFKILTKMKSGIDLQAGVHLSVTVDRGRAAEMLRELRLAVNDLGLKDRLRVRRDEE
ncbi:MAG: DUF499 domain-containing protein [Gemmatimonadota bacterium]|nr:DUF499 domain-containing protein [Gemmatimonadota bacterium]